MTHLGTWFGMAVGSAIYHCGWPSLDAVSFGGAALLTHWVVLRALSALLVADDWPSPPDDDVDAPIGETQ